MTDVLLGQSYFLRFDVKLWQAMKPYAPLGTLYAASLLRQAGYQVELFDAMLADSVAEWSEALEHSAPRFAVLFEDNFNYLSKMCLLNMRQAAIVMIKAAKRRDCVAIVGGADASDHPDLYLHAGADFVLLGEGDVTLPQLLDALTGKTNEELTNIAGLAFASGSGSRPGFEVSTTAPRPVLKDIDALPLPAWDLVNIERYRQVWRGRHGYFSMNMVTTRGCPYHCNWCAKPIWGQRYAARRPASVVAEMQWLRQQFGADHIWFADDIMGLKPGWWQEFAGLALKHDTATRFKCLSRADLVVRDRQYLESIKAAGCEIMWIGAESGSQRILDSMEKGITVSQIRQAAASLKSAGIEVGFFLQFGYPGEERTDIEKTLQLLRDCQPDDIGVSVSYPLPGTKFYESVRTQLGATQNWLDSADLAMLYHGTYDSAFYRQLHAVVHKEFRSQRSRRQLRNVSKQPRAWRPRHVREAARALWQTISLLGARRRLDSLAVESGHPLQAAPALSFSEARRPSAQPD